MNGLILTRRIDQAIVINGNITVMVVGVERDRAKLLIEAPDDVLVLREELLSRKREPLRAAVTRRLGIQ